MVPRTGARGRQGWQKMPLVGFVVTKKVSKSACKRNKVKRQTREAYRYIARQVLSGAKSHIEFGQWYILVFTIHSQCLTSSYDQIVKAVESCLIRACKRYGSQIPAIKTSWKDDHDVNRETLMPREIDNN